jgi:fructosamine-3-kinase
MNDAIQNLLSEIAIQNSHELIKYSPLSGGDINEVFLLECKSGKFVVKLNHTHRFPGMFKAEKFGLNLLKEANVIDIPKTFSTGSIGDRSYLLLEYISSGEKTTNFWSEFGEKLAQLHKCSNPNFGLKADNYIGSLPQYNDHMDNASDFYIEMRLEPQFKMAADLGFALKIPNSFYPNLEKLIPSEPASLIHGDLWSGNFIVNAEGSPCLIDPAVAYAPREMDLAMMKLFGGFDEELFKIYHETFPLESDWRDRVEIWQLYYLLVHLNIFGSSYKGRVQSIIDKYS